VPRLSPEDRKRMETDVIAGRMTGPELQEMYGVSDVTVKAYRRRLRVESKAIEERTTRKLTETSLDTQAERKADLDILQKAVLDPVLKKIHGNLPLGAGDIAILLKALQTRTKILDGHDNSHKLQISYFDNRDQSVNVVEVRAEVQAETAGRIFGGPLLCPECGADVSGPLLARHTKEEVGD